MLQVASHVCYYSHSAFVNMTVGCCIIEPYMLCCVCVCVRACVRAWVRACVRACVLFVRMQVGNASVGVSACL